MGSTRNERSWSPQPGRIVWRAVRNDPSLEYFLYFPPSVGKTPRVLTCIHGNSRNAHEHATAFAPVCEEYGAVLVAPIFSKELHRDYQRLGRKGRGARTDRTLHQVLAEVATLTGVDTSRFRLFGYSAGAQFAHRYLMVHPHRVERAAIASAGWYSFPDTTERFPYGIRPSPNLPGVAFNPEEFLKVPVDVFVGSQDTSMRDLRSTERTVEQQGVTRVDRARNWVAAMRSAAAAFDLEPRVQLTEVPDIAHSFSRFIAEGDLANRVGRALFQATTGPDSIPLERLNGASTTNGRHVAAPATRRRSG